MINTNHFCTCVLTLQINVLLQAYISQLKLEGFALMADMVYVTQVRQDLQTLVVPSLCCGQLKEIVMRLTIILYRVLED